MVSFFYNLTDLNLDIFGKLQMEGIPYITGHTDHVLFMNLFLCGRSIVTININHFNVVCLKHARFLFRVNIAINALLC